MLDSLILCYCNDGRVITRLHVICGISFTPFSCLDICYVLFLSWLFRDSSLRVRPYLVTTLARLSVLLGYITVTE